MSESGRAHSDVFISHASEDKPRIAPLLKAFDNFSITYWIDAADIGWGERWLERIREGLLSTNIVVVIVTDEFIRKQWTKYELALASEQEKAGALRLLPLVDVDQSTLEREFPSLAAKNYLKLSVPASAVAERVGELLGRRFDRYWTHHHQPQYSGRVWIKLRAKQENNNAKHRYTISWGPWYRGGSVVCRSSEAVALMHSKGTDGLSLPLVFEVEPECYVTFGEGDPKVPTVVNINNFWIAAKNGVKLFIARNFLWK
jgi:TIR domain-containing protein